MVKTCSRCNQSKPLDQFNRASRAKDGHYVYCRDCQREARREWYVKTRERQKRSVDQKTCTVCGQEKPSSQFYKDPATKDGLKAYCKECARVYQQRWYHERGGALSNAHYYRQHRDHYLDWHAEQRKTAQRRAYMAQYQKAYQPDRQKVRARRQVRVAIARGDLIYPDRCVRCGRVGAVEAHHHHGYDEAHALDVIFVCSRCHGELDHPCSEQPREESVAVLGH